MGQILLGKSASIRGVSVVRGSALSWTPVESTRLETDNKIQRETGPLLAASLRQRKILSNFGLVFVFSLLFRRTCRDHEDFEKHYPPLELSFCSAAASEYFDQRYNSKAAIYYCSLSPPATINISPSH